MICSPVIERIPSRSMNSEVGEVSLVTKKDSTITSAQMMKLHLRSALERVQRLRQSSGDSAMAGTSEFSPQPLPINYISVDNSNEYNIEVLDDARSISAAPSGWR